MPSIGGFVSGDTALFWARVVALVHMLVVGFTVAGGIALFRGRFERFSWRDPFAFGFYACCVGQLLSLALFGTCILTAWEKELLTIAGQEYSYDGTFLQRFFPGIPDRWATRGVPLLTLAALLGGLTQAGLAWRHRRRIARHMEGVAARCEGRTEGAGGVVEA